MLQNGWQVLFGIIKNNKISITGGVELLKDEDSNSSACSKYLKHLCREEYFYPSYAPTGEYKPYNESVDIQYNIEYVSAVLLSNKYQSTTNSTPKELYELQCKLERYHKSFDEMCSYIETYSSSINKYKEHTKQPSISTFELIRLIIDKDEILCRYIDEEIELNRLKDSVKAIDRDFHLGYIEFIRIRGYRLYDLNVVQMKDICNNMCYIQSLDSEQKAIQLSNKYPDAFKIIYSGCSTINATIARDICRNEGKLRTLQERVNEVETIKRKAQKNNAYDSYIDGIPLYFFYWYYKKSFTDISDESEYARQMIYSFKDGRSHFTPQKLICEKLSGIYNESELKQLTFACVPASILMDNYKRLHSFYNDVCETLGMKNGFEHIHNTKSGTPSHRGGTGIEDIEVDTNFFKDALVVVFDDITTKGRSMRLLIRKLQEAGATVIYCLALGKTYSDYYGEARKPHPHTGNI